LLLVMAEQQHPQRLRQAGIGERVDEHRAQARRQQRIATRRDAHRGGEPLELAAQRGELGLVALLEDLAQALRSEVQVDQVFFDETERDTATRVRIAEFLEALRDLLAEAHGVARAARAQHGETRLFRVHLGARFTQVVLDRQVQCRRESAQLLDGQALDLLQHARGIEAGSVVRVQRSEVHCRTPGRRRVGSSIDRR
jgi:hypothetical protein